MYKGCEPEASWVFTAYHTIERSTVESTESNALYNRSSGNSRRSTVAKTNDPAGSRSRFSACVEFTLESESQPESNPLPF